MKFQNILSFLRKSHGQLGQLEARVLELEQKIDKLIQIERNHLVRVKNHEEVSDDFIEQGRRYLDLSPDKAWKLYCNNDFDFVMIDVSELVENSTIPKIRGALSIPWSSFHERFLEIQSKTTPILIISEDGTTSVLACEFLAKRGFYNTNNISGGYKFWKGFQLLNGLTA